jgi:hypothetical protein
MSVTQYQPSKARAQERRGLQNKRAPKRINRKWRSYIGDTLCDGVVRPTLSCERGWPTKQSRELASARRRNNTSAEVCGSTDK